MKINRNNIQSKLWNMGIFMGYPRKDSGGIARTKLWYLSSKKPIGKEWGYDYKDIKVKFKKVFKKL